MTRVKILVVDDDLRLRDLLNRYLSEQGFGVHVAQDAAAMDKLLARERFDLIVLDLMMPGEDGLSVCRRLRGAKDTIPIIMLTARGDDVDRIVGLELGADDYLPKPFNPRELVARLRALLRRSRAAPAGPARRAERRVGDAVVRPGERFAAWRGKPLELTSPEFNLLEALLRNAGRVLSKRELSEVVLGRPITRFDRGIDMHVSNLRRKLGQLDDGR